jgi:hypothetical protein
MKTGHVLLKEQLTWGEMKWCSRRDDTEVIGVTQDPHKNEFSRRSEKDRGQQLLKHKDVAVKYIYAARSLRHELWP